MTRIGIVSDTHNRMHPQVFEVFDGVDSIFHAGDIGDEEILIGLRAIAPVYPITGNTDSFEMLQKYPPARCQKMAGTTIAMTHIVEPFDEAGIQHLIDTTPAFQCAPAVLIYGHTHQAKIAQIGDILTINPGSAGPRRFETRPSVAFLEIAADGRLHAWSMYLR